MTIVLTICIHLQKSRYSFYYPSLPILYMSLICSCALQLVLSLRRKTGHLSSRLFIMILQMKYLFTYRESSMLHSQPSWVCKYLLIPPDFYGYQSKQLPDIISICIAIYCILISISLVFLISFLPSSFFTPLEDIK